MVTLTSNAGLIFLTFVQYYYILGKNIGLEEEANFLANTCIGKISGINKSFKFWIKVTLDNISFYLDYAVLFNVIIHTKKKNSVTKKKIFNFIYYNMLYYNSVHINSIQTFLKLII